MRVDLDAPTPEAKPITRTRTARNSPELLEGWVDGDTLLLLANDDGFSNLYGYSRKTGKVTQLTRYTEDLDSARLVGNEVIAVHRTPAGSTVVRLDALGDTLLSTPAPARSSRPSACPAAPT